MSTATLEPEPTTIQETDPETCPRCARQWEIALSDEPIESPLPAEFLDALQNTCFENLTAYLAANGAPEEALGMLDSIMCLGQFMATLAELGGKVRTREHQTMLDVVSRACRLNAAIGGEFYGAGYSVQPTGEPVIWGQFKPEELQNSLGE